MYTVKNDIKNVLVSGAGDDIGMGVGRILLSEGVENVYGCDIDIDNAGICLFREFIEVPRAKQEEYFYVLEKILKEYEIDFFIPTSEAEIKALTKFGVVDGEIFNTPVLMANPFAIETSLDKFRTANFLTKNNLPAPWTVPVEKGPPKELPCIFKPRSGQGSKGIEVVTTHEQAAELEQSSGYIWQELLLPDEQEYTCPVFRSSDGHTRVMIMNRKLQSGVTERGTVIENPQIEAYLLKICDVLSLKGAINIQLRKTEQGPVLFEINPRLSSTVMFRHKMGFKDLLWSIEDHIHGTVCHYDTPKAGTKFYRGYFEYISSN